MAREDQDSQMAHQPAPKPSGAQTLLRGLSVLEIVAEGPCEAGEIVRRMDLPRATVHRMLRSLVEAGYLHHVPYRGYGLGFRLIHLGHQATAQRPYVDIARPRLEDLSRATGETIHFGLRDGSDVLYLEKIPSPKAYQTRSSVGQRMPLASTGIGRALILDVDQSELRTLYDHAVAAKKSAGEPVLLPDWNRYAQDMARYRAAGWVMDLEENEAEVNCVAAPVRDITGAIIASISVAALVPYMPEARMRELGELVLETATRLSADFGRQ